MFDPKNGAFFRGSGAAQLQSFASRFEAAEYSSQRLSLGSVEAWIML
jgi:hypothetical protein